MSAPKIFGTIEKSLGSSGLGPDDFEADLITGTLDLAGDITPAYGATPSSGTVPLLWQHNADTPIGVAYYRRSGDKIVIRCTLLPEDTSPTVRLARACAKKDYGMGVSAGFQPTKTSRIPGSNGGVVYESYRLLEASLVSVPCDPNARITARDYRPSQISPHRKDIGNMTREERMAHAEAVRSRGEHPEPAGAPLPLTVACRIEDAKQMNEAARVLQENSQETRAAKAARVLVAGQTTLLMDAGIEAAVREDKARRRPAPETPAWTKAF